MNYMNISKCDTLNGEGIRTVLWCAGCSHHCKFCHNPETWNPNAGLVFDEAAEKELFDELGKKYVDGLTLSGGDPLFCSNRETVLRIAKKAKELYPNKNIWMWSGFVWDAVKDLEIMEYIDVLVDGPFINDQKDTSLYWRGSKNQRVIDVQKTRKEGKVVLFCE